MTATVGTEKRAACGVQTPLFFRIAAQCTKVFTPGTSDFPRSFRYFAS